MSVLSAYKLAKSFGVQEIFRDVSLQINAAEKVALLGPNGAGKTTLLHILARQDTADSGEVITTRGLRISYLPQEAALPGDATLYQAMLAAFADLRAQEATLRDLEAQMSAGGPGLESVMADYAALSHRFEEAGGYTYEQRIGQVLSGLGFGRQHYDQPVSILSGGQRTRAALAQLLLSSPDLLLLDEPTNHLDLAALEWLEDYLIHWPGALILVAHDRRFLDKVVTRVLELAYGRLEDYPGNYTRYTELRADRLERRLAEYQTQAAFIAKTKEFIRKYGAGQRAKEAKGREKRLARLQRLQKPQEWQRLHLNLTTQRRSGDLVLRVRDLVVGYSQPLFATPELTIHRGDRVALLGPNGCGKTTLLKVILGQLAPLAGEVRLGANVRPGYYAQAHEGLNPEATILDTIFPFFSHLVKTRGFLGRYLFSGDDVYKHLGDLSGGERSRVALAVLALQGANLLLLDEPTNHLDLLSQEVLEDVLGDFPGTLLFVSHDRYFIDALATAVWAVEEQRLVAYRGDYEDYLELRAEAAERGSSGAGEQRGKGAEGRGGSRPQSATRKPNPLLSELEARIGALEGRLAELGEELTQASQSMEVDKVRTLGQEYQAIQEQLDQAYTAWEDALAT